MEEKNSQKGNVFLGIRKIDDLAAILGVRSVQLKTLALNPDYNTFKIPKKSGGFRTIEAPSQALKRVQKNLNYHLQHVYLLFRPEFVHGFTIKTEKEAHPPGIISNARAHISRSNIMSLDLVDFFHSFSAKSVWDLFRKDPFNFPEPLANILTMLTTWYDILPMGSPVSPVLSNFLTFNLDHKLSVFTASQNGIYTRYADDITFSFNCWISDEIIQKIKMIISEEGFRINEKKFRIQSENARQMVTGLVVNNKVNINRRYIRQLRTVLFDWRVNGIDRAARNYYKLRHYPDHPIKYRFQKSVKGRIQFIGYVRGKNDRIFKNLNEQYKIIQSSQD